MVTCSGMTMLVSRAASLQVKLVGSKTLCKSLSVNVCRMSVCASQSRGISVGKFLILRFLVNFVNNFP